MPAVVQEPIEKKTETPPSPAKAKSTTKAGQSQTGARRVGKKKSRPAWLLPSMLGGCVLLLSGLVGILTWNKDTSIPQKEVTKVEEKQVATNTVPSLPTESQSTDSTTKTTKTRSVDPLDDQFMISKSDETLPWVPPRSSQPYSLSMLPPGAQGFIFIRPQAWLTTQGGQAIAQALDDSIGKFWKPIEKASGTPLESIVEIAIGLYPGKADGWPVLAYRIQLSEETSIANLKERLTNATEQSVNNKHSVLMNGDQAIFLGTAQQINDEARQFMAVGPAALIRELAEMDGDGAPLRRQMEQLWQSSDANSDLTLLLTTGFFFSDARNVLPSISPRVSTLCKELLDEKTQAILISTTLEPQWYGELRIMGKDGDDATRFVQVTRDRMKLVADAMESDLVANPASLYWRAIASRYPQMLRALTRYIRFGVENGQAISNFYLPSAASANMTIASWMAVQTQSNSPSGPVKVAQEVPTNELKGDDLLGHPVSINFEQEPLDSALALLTEEINRSLPKGTGPIALSIDGKSFELASVTRNQQIRDFRFKEQPLRVLLTDITARINPDRTVKSLDEAKQAVVWVLTEADGKSNVLFTTRRGIEGTDRKLPIEYQAATKP